jgi:dihydrofolate reductase
MRKLIYQAMTSLDGYFEGPNGEIDWHTVDEEFNEYAADLLNNTEILLFGRKTYNVMEAWWPREEAIRTDPVIAAKMNSLSKFVFSRTMKEATWQNTELVKEHAAEKMLELKKERGEYMVIFGSSHLALTCMGHKLIDEYRIIVSPVLLGAGHSLFNGLHKKADMKIESIRTFVNGNVLLTYGLK